MSENEPRQYIKKPIVIEAMQFDGSNVTSVPIARWAIEHGVEIEEYCDNPWEGYYLEVPTLEGVMRANEDDWIIKGVNNEFYPCKPDIFEKTYDPVNSPTTGEGLKG